MDAASIKQMNKVRASLGLAPLPIPGAAPSPAPRSTAGDASDSDDDMSTLDKRTAAAGDNWRKLEAERREKLDRQKRKEAAKKSRDAAQRFARLQGRGLGEAEEGEELDTRSWLLQQKKRQKEIERQRKSDKGQPLQILRDEYTAKDLAGVKVAHELQEFEDASAEQILTLKDAEIGSESEEDELENAELNAKAKLEEKLRLLKKRPDYDPTDQEQPNGILSKYDEEISGKQAKHFTLDGAGTSSRAQKRLAEAEDQPKTRGVRVDLNAILDQVPTSDYLAPSTTKIRKAKPRKEKRTRQKTDEGDFLLPEPERQDQGQMEVDGQAVDSATAGKKHTLQFDDEDLQSQLAQSRRQALKKRKKTDAAELARQMRAMTPTGDAALDEDAVVMDETSEFVANLKFPETQKEATEKLDRNTGAYKTEQTPGQDDTMEDAGSDLEDRSDLKEEQVEARIGNVTTTGLEAEEMTDSGVAATLAMLRKRGLMETSDAALTHNEASRREFLAGKQQVIDEFDRKAREQREADRQSGRWAKMSNRERDAHAQKENERREAFLAKLLADKFNKEYRPDVKLEYYDEFGRSMNKKEAFRHISHMFHGKGSGKQKTEKRLKKIDDEKKDMAKGVLDIGNEGGMAGVQGREGRRQKQAGVRLQ